MTYRAPVKDMLFVMKELAGIDAVAQLPGYEEAGFDTAAAVLEESARFTGDVLAPLNAEGDKAPSTFRDGKASRIELAAASNVRAVYAASGQGNGTVYRSLDLGPFTATAANSFCNPQCFYTNPNPK